MPTVERRVASGPCPRALLLPDLSENSLPVGHGWILMPNVRAEAGPTAKRQARVVENVPAHCAGLAF